MSPRTQQQFEEMRDSRRLQIMETALKLFATEGYGHCSISMLAKDAGISKGLMYNYYDSKEALLEAIIEHGLDEIMELFDPDHDGVLSSEELVQFIRDVFSTMRNHHSYWVLFISVIMQPRVKELLYNKPIIQYIEQFMSMLLVYFEKKGFKDPDLEMFTLSALIEGFGMMLIYSDLSIEFPSELMDKFENRIIDMYK